MKNLAFLVLALVASNSIAVTESDIELMTAEEINALPFDEIQDIPYLLLMNKSGIGPEAGNLLAATSLAKLMYFFDTQSNDLSAAIKKFQRDIGVEQSGELTFGEFTQLTDRAEALNINDVNLPGFTEQLFVYENDGYMSVQGTWIIDGENIAYPINTAQITCYGASSSCQQAQAKLLSLTDASNQNLILDVFSYTVVSWVDGEIIARPTTPSECRNQTLTINSRTGDVFEMQTNGNREGCEILDKPRISRLVAGYQLSRDYWNAKRETAEEGFNRDYRDALGKLAESMSSSN